MKSWERAAAIIIACVSLASAGQAVAVLPYRIQQTEKENAALRIEFAAEKAKAQEAKEAMIRMEEQLKAIRQTVESIDRYQKRLSQNQGNPN